MNVIKQKYVHMMSTLVWKVTGALCKHWLANTSKCKECYRITGCVHNRSEYAHKLFLRHQHGNMQRHNQKQCINAVDECLLVNPVDECLLVNAVDDCLLVNAVHECLSVESSG